MQWNIEEVSSLSWETIEALFTGKIGGVRLPNFFSSEMCERATKSILDHGFDFYENVEPPIGRIGITQFEHAKNFDTKHNYFKKVREATEVRRTLFKDTIDPVEQMVQVLSQFVSCRVAVEEPEEQYFAGLVRIMHEALLHIDFAPRDARGWNIAKISAQIGWNVMLQTSEGGGETTVYRRLWGEDDDNYKIVGSYGYSDKLVLGAETVTITPRTGDLILFNSQHFHKVLRIHGDTMRITCGSFIGLTPEKSLILWS